jgi:hemerythrin
MGNCFTSQHQIQPSTPSFDSIVVHLDPVRNTGWDNAKYSCNDILIDKQHKTLFVILDNMKFLYKTCHIDKNNLGKLSENIEQLESYIKYHFTHEEFLLDIVCSDKKILMDHKYKHKKFTEYIKKISENFFKHPNETTFLLIDFVEKWLVNHIVNEDKRLLQK